MKYQSYGPEQYAQLKDGVYFVLKAKNKTKVADSVYICEGHMINTSMTKINAKLTKCYLQKYRELGWETEGELLGLLEEAGLLEKRNQSSQSQSKDEIILIAMIKSLKFVEVRKQ